MGWSWAVFLLQTGQLHQLSASRPHALWMEDKRVARPIGPPHSSLTDAEPDVDEIAALFVDNFVSLSWSPTIAGASVAAMKSKLDGLHVASELDPPDAVDFIGFQLASTGTFWRPTKKKLSRAAGSLLELWSGTASFTGMDVEKVVGYVAHLFGIRCDLFSCLSAVYKFIDISYAKRQPLWPSVRREFRWCWALLPLAVAKMDREWHSTVHTYDASPSGYGVVSCEFSPHDVAKVGRQREKYRFRGIHAKQTGPRSDALGSTGSAPALGSR